MNFAAWKRPLTISAVLAAGMAVLAWYFDPLFVTLLCLVAILWQIVRLLVDLLRWNKNGLALGGVRLVIWVGAMAATIGALDYYTTRAQAGGEALVAALQAYRAREGRYPEKLEALAPRDIAAVPLMPSPPGRSERSFYYRLSGEHFRLMYYTGIRMGKEFDSSTGKWEALD